MYRSLKIPIAILATLVLPTASVAQTAALRGVVVDSATLVSIPGAAIEVSPGGQSALTDASGAFAVEGLGVGSHLLQIAAAGFADLEFQFTLTADQLTDVDVGLIPLTRPQLVNIRMLGAVVDGGTKDGIAGAEIYIDEYYVGSVNVYGAFDFSLEASVGEHQIRIRRVGYSLAEYKMAVDAPGRVDFEFVMVPLPVALEEIEVTVPEAIRGKLAGFYRRRQQEFGRFMTPEEVAVAKETSRSATDILEKMRGVRATPDEMGRKIELMRCREPSFWIDGLQMQLTYLEDVLNVDDIAAIEVYDGATRLPLEFNRAPFAGAGAPASGCGAVVIWTQTGN